MDRKFITVRFLGSGEGFKLRLMSHISKETSRFCFFSDELVSIHR